MPYRVAAPPTPRPTEDVEPPDLLAEDLVVTTDARPLDVDPMPSVATVSAQFAAMAVFLAAGVIGVVLSR